MTLAKSLKNKYLKVRKDAFDSGKLNIIGQNDGVYTTGMLAALRDMAKNNVYPDGNFGDDECNVWSMFR
jgi:hypothetical protein